MTKKSTMESNILLIYNYKYNNLVNGTIILKYKFMFSLTQVFIILVSLLRSIKTHTVLLEIKFIYHSSKNLESASSPKNSHRVAYFLYKTILL